jgi:hypothetical protein
VRRRFLLLLMMMMLADAAAGQGEVPGGGQGVLGVHAVLYSLRAESYPLLCCEALFLREERGA